MGSGQGFQHVFLEREPLRVQGKVQLRAFDGIDTAVDESFGADRLLPEACHQFPIPIHGPVPVEIPHGFQGQRYRGVERKPVQIHLEESIPIQDDNPVTMAFRQRQTDSSPGSKGFLFHGITDFERPVPGVDIVENHFPEIAHRKDDMRNVEALQPVQHILQEGPSIHRGHALGNLADHAAETRSQSAGEDYRFHTSGTLSVG